ncbi:MAG: ATP-binding protein [Anaerolineae bacterium]|nr:ATP-binding protein [Anaerolineae bacterium]
MQGKIRAQNNQLVSLLAEADADVIAEHLVAFANADGGTLYIGANDAGKPTGQVYPEDISDALEQAEVMCKPPVPVIWDQMEVSGAFVFVIRVHRSSDLHTLADGKILVRTGTENRVLTGTQVQQIAKTRLTGNYESEPVPGATREDIDPEVLREFTEVWQERQGRPITRPIDDVLVEMNWLLPSGQPTVAGLLLFGRNPAVFLPRCGITFVRFDGTQVRLQGVERSYGRRVEVNGHLADVIKRTWDIIQEEIRSGAVVKGLKREENWIYPPAAIREALVNAVAHRDYHIRGRGIEVRLFTDRLEIYSPGGLAGFITLDNIVDEHFSRNPRIVNGLYQWGYIEELGLGVDLMIEEMANAGHPIPEFKDTDHSFMVTFRNTQTRHPISVTAESSTMNERQAKALTYLQQNGRIRNREYQELCPDVSPETLRLDLSDLVERGILLKIGEKRGTYYIMK